MKLPLLIFLISISLTLFFPLGLLNFALLGAIILALFYRNRSSLLLIFVLLLFFDIINLRGLGVSFIGFIFSGLMVIYLFKKFLPPGFYISIATLPTSYFLSTYVSSFLMTLS